jgi:RNA polymerase sigma-70 factor (ECF subfamily)
VNEHPVALRHRTPAVPLPPDFLAFHQLYRSAYVRWAELHLGTRAAAEEAVDHAFTHLAAEWRQVLRHDSPAGRAWEILKRHTAEAARAAGRPVGAVDAAAAFDTHALRTAVDPVGELAETLSVYRAIGDLPERQRDVIVLRYCLGYDVRETADILGVSEPGVRSTARYARHRLQELLGLHDPAGAEGPGGERGDGPIG